MEFLLLVYSDEEIREALPEGEYESRMRYCLQHADELKEQGTLKSYRQLEAPSTGKSVRIRNGKTTVFDGPFAETKEVLAGFNLIEADSLEQAVEIAKDIPWAQTGCIEVRPVRDADKVRRSVGA
jgi:hypothetical protein